MLLNLSQCKVKIRALSKQAQRFLSFPNLLRTLVSLRNIFFLTGQVLRLRVIIHEAFSALAAFTENSIGTDSSSYLPYNPPKLFLLCSRRFLRNGSLARPTCIEAYTRVCKRTK